MSLPSTTSESSNSVESTQTNFTQESEVVSVSDLLNNAAVAWITLSITAILCSGIILILWYKIYKMQRRHSLKPESELSSLQVEAPRVILSTPKNSHSHTTSSAVLSPNLTVPHNKDHNYTFNSSITCTQSNSKNASHSATFDFSNSPREAQSKLNSMATPLNVPSNFFQSPQTTVMPETGQFLENPLSSVVSGSNQIQAILKQNSGASRSQNSDQNDIDTSSFGPLSQENIRAAFVQLSEKHNTSQDGPLQEIALSKTDINNFGNAYEKFAKNTQQDGVHVSPGKRPDTPGMFASQPKRPNMVLTGPSNNSVHMANISTHGNYEDFPQEDSSKFGFAKGLTRVQLQTPPPLTTLSGPPAGETAGAQTVPGLITSISHVTLENIEMTEESDSVQLDNIKFASVSGADPYKPRTRAGSSMRIKVHAPNIKAMGSKDSMSGLTDVTFTALALSMSQSNGHTPISCVTPAGVQVTNFNNVTDDTPERQENPNASLPKLSLFDSKDVATFTSMDSNYTNLETIISKDDVLDTDEFVEVSASEGAYPKQSGKCSRPREWSVSVDPRMKTAETLKLETEPYAVRLNFGALGSTEVEIPPSTHSRVSSRSRASAESKSVTFKGDKGDMYKGDKGDNLMVASEEIKKLTMSPIAESNHSASDLGPKRYSC